MFPDLRYSDEIAVVIVDLESRANHCPGVNENACPYSRKTSQQSSEKLKCLAQNWNVHALVNPVLESVNNNRDHSQDQEIANRPGPLIVRPPALLDVLLAPPVEVAAQILKHFPLRLLRFGPWYQPGRLPLPNP